MKVGSKYKLDQALKHHWIELSALAGLSEPDGLVAMNQMATLFLRNAN